MQRMVGGTMRQRERQRAIVIGIVVVVAGAIGAFVLTMSMTTSYPSSPAAAAFARDAMERASVTNARHAPAPSRSELATALDDAVVARVVHGRRSREGDTERRGARGSVMVDDGEAPRSRGALGTLAREDVQAGVAAVKDRVKDCYERGLQIDPALAGVVKVAFTLEGDDTGKGVVTQGEVAESDMNSPFFEACVLKEIAGAAFKAPGGGGVVNVTYPFRFENVADDADDADP